MSAPDPAASDDYSRAPGPFRRAPAAPPGVPGDAPGPAASGPPAPVQRPASGARRGSLALSLGGAVLLILSEFGTLYTVGASTGAAHLQARVLGHQQHGYALALIGVAALVLVLGAARRAGRSAAPASAALAMLGLLALIIGAVGDRADVVATGLLGRLFDRAVAHPGAGYRLELVGAILLMLGGVLALLAPAGGGRRYQR